MKLRLLTVAALAVLCVSLPADLASARGGRGGGGFGGGRGFGGRGFGGDRGWGGDRGFGDAGDRGFREGGFDGQRFNDGGDRVGGEETVRNQYVTPDRGELNRFLNMPQGAGREGVQRAADAGARGTDAAARTAGPRGPAGGFARVTPATRAAAGAAVRNNFHDFGVYGRGWYGRHPGAWFAAGWAADAAWDAATWPALAGWFDYASDDVPTDYDYGTNVVYANGNVYSDGEDEGTADEYYDQAAALANTGAQTDASSDEQWLPLGVFALSSSSGHDQANITIQLAVNKQGIIRGNYSDTHTDQTFPIQGSVDKDTQRVAFTVADFKSTVFDTGLYNLTKDEAPVLIHEGTNRTKQWLLVRLKRPENQTDNSDN